MKTTREFTLIEGFTLIEMLLATAIFALLLGGLLQIMSGLARDTKTMRGVKDERGDRNVASLIQWDLTNADQMIDGSRPADSTQSPPIVLVGHGGIDRQSLQPDQRLARVVYELVPGPDGACTLWRRQSYLDDPVRPATWGEVVCSGVTHFSIMSDSAPALSTRVTLDVEMQAGHAPSIHQQLWVK